jgi:hypothetical protein
MTCWLISSFVGFVTLTESAGLVACTDPLLASLVASTKKGNVTIKVHNTAFIYFSLFSMQLIVEAKAIKQKNRYRISLNRLTLMISV